MANLTKNKAHIYAIRIGVREIELKSCSDPDRKNELQEEIADLVNQATKYYGPEAFFVIDEELHKYLKTRGY